MINSPSIVGFLSFWMLAMIMHFQIKMPKVEVSKQDSAVNFSQDFLTYFSIGQKRLIADLLWVQTLIESDLDHYSKNDLNSWMFLRFNNIAKLDRNFYENYYFGGLYLSVVKDDIDGGITLLNKGSKLFSNDFKINFQLGYLYAFEKRDFKNAQIIYSRIKNSQEKPFYFDSLYGKILNNSLGPEEALSYSILSLNRAPKNSPIYEKLTKNIYQLKALIDLKCLNSNFNNCDKFDYFGNKYILKRKKFYSLIPQNDLNLKFGNNANSK